MKLKKLNKALIAAGLVAGAAVSMPSQAVVMSDDGTGEVLIYPFYTVQGPSDAARSTLFTVVNTTRDYKAVKVRFHDAHNSRDAKDFNVYLSPNDVWTGAVTRDADGIAQVITTDTTCTIPSTVMSKREIDANGDVVLDDNGDQVINQVPNTFSTAAYSQDVNNDGGNQDALRTNEGYIEVIEMGVIGADIPLVAGDGSVDGGDLNTLRDAILHVDGVPGGSYNEAGIPVGCEALQTAYATGGTWVLATNAEIDAGSPTAVNNTHVGVTQPTGGLAGTAMIVQALTGTVAAYNATALKSFYDVASVAECDVDPSDGGSTAINTIDAATGFFCETSTGTTGFEFTTTNRAFDDLHSFKDLDARLANARSVQTYPNLAMAYPQISTIFDPDASNVGAAVTLEWSDNEAVSSGVTDAKDNVLFAAVRDLDIDLSNDAPAIISKNGAAAADCGGIDGAISAPAVDGICGNARPVSAVLAANNLINEYTLAEAVGLGQFKTDVVVTFPTKWYFSDNGLYDTDSDTVVDSSIAATAETVGDLEAVKLAPFSTQFVSSGTKRDQACERFSMSSSDKFDDAITAGSLYNREEGEFSVISESTGLVPSPAINEDAPVDQNFFCHEANVMTINDGDLLTSRIANGLDATVGNSADAPNSFNITFPESFKEGWFDIAFDKGGDHVMSSVAAGPMDAVGSPYAVAVDGAGADVTGLPAVGFVVQGFIGSDGGFDGNFTAAFPHKTK